MPDWLLNAGAACADTASASVAAPCSSVCTDEHCAEELIAGLSRAGMLSSRRFEFITTMPAVGTELACSSALCFFDAGLLRGAGSVGALVFLLLPAGDNMLSQRSAGASREQEIRSTRSNPAKHRCDKQCSIYMSIIFSLIDQLMDISAWFRKLGRADLNILSVERHNYSHLKLLIYIG